MFRLAPGLVGVALFALWIWAVLDVIATDNVLIRNLQKIHWLILVIIVPTVGAVAWLALGRPANAGFTPGSTVVRPNFEERKPAPRGPEDSDTWRSSTKPSVPTSTATESESERERRLKQWEADLAKREAELEDPTED